MHTHTTHTAWSSLCVRTYVCMVCSDAQQFEVCVSLQCTQTFAFDHCFWSMNPNNPKFSGECPHHTDKACLAWLIGDWYGIRDCRVATFVICALTHTHTHGWFRLEVLTIYAHLYVRYTHTNTPIHVHMYVRIYYICMHLHSMHTYPHTAAERWVYISSSPEPLFIRTSCTASVFGVILGCLLGHVQSQVHTYGRCGERVWIPAHSSMCEHTSVV